MRRFHFALSVLIILLGTGLMLWLLQLESITPAQSSDLHDAHGHEDSHDTATGPRGGILLGQDREIQLEIKPQKMAFGQLGFEFYAYRKSQAIALAPENLQVVWQRLKEPVAMPVQPIAEGLQSSTQISAPHSFKMRLTLQQAGQSYDYHWEKWEHRLQLSDEQIQANQVDFSRVGPQTLNKEIQLPGQIAVDQEREAHVSPRISGVVLEVHKHLGDPVKQGELLARINSRELGSLKEDYQSQQARFQQAKKLYQLEQEFQTNTHRLLKELADGKALSEIHQDILDTPIGSDRSRLVQAYTTLELAEKNYRRELSLSRARASTELELELAHKAYIDSQAAYRGLIEEIDRQRRLRVLEKKSILEQIQPRLEMARNKLQVLGVGAGDSSTLYDLRSPINGIVLSKHITPGESLMVQEKAFILADLSTVWAEMMIPESQLERVQIGVPVRVESQGGQRQQRGVVSHLGGQVDESSRTAEAHAVIPNPDYFWKPGMFVSLKLQTQATPVKMAVRPGAIQYLNDQAFVFVRAEQNQIQGFPVVLGLETRQWVEIQSGLQPGQSYVSNNAYILKAELEKASASHSH